MTKDVNSLKTMEKMLPEFKKELDYLNSDSFREYEKKLGDVTTSALDSLDEIIKDDTLKMDPEQLVNAVRVMTTARKDIMESKRRLLETVIKGEVMMRAVDTDKDKNNNGESLLLDYMKKNIENNANSSIFQQIEENE
mgnify:CR=1 FL=1